MFLSFSSSISLSLLLPVPTAIPESPFPLGSSDLRTSVLNLQGTPITQLSTSRLFAYITHFKAAPLGLEWISDQSCNVVFASFSDARDGLVKLLSQKEYNDIATNQSDLIPETEKLLDENNKEKSSSDLNPKTLEELLKVRKAKKLPSKLYTAKEKDLALKYSDPSLDLVQEPQLEEESLSSTLPSDIPEIYRDFEMEDRLKAREEYENGQGGEIKTLKSLRGQLFIRFALSSHDVKQKKSRDQSGWYKKYGDKAGKEVVGRLLVVGEKDERRELLDDVPPGPTELEERMFTLEDRLSSFNTRRPRNEDTSISSFASRLDKRREVLDDELDQMRNRRESGRERSRSPDRIRDNVRVRGRGGIRAPEDSGMSSAWDNSYSDDYQQEDGEQDEDQDGVMRSGHGSFRSRMVSDEIEIENATRRSKNRRNDRWNNSTTAVGDGNRNGNTLIKGTGNSSGSANNSGGRKGRGRFKAADFNDLASRFGPPPGSEQSLEGRLSAWKE